MKEERERETKKGANKKEKRASAEEIKEGEGGTLIYLGACPSPKGRARTKEEGRRARERERETKK